MKRTKKFVIKIVEVLIGKRFATTYIIDRPNAVKNVVIVPIKVNCFNEYPLLS